MPFAHNCIKHPNKHLHLYAHKNDFCKITSAREKFLAIFQFTNREISMANVSKVTRQIAAFAAALVGKTKISGVYDWYPGSIVPNDVKPKKNK